MTDRKSPHHGKRDAAHNELEGGHAFGAVPSADDARDFPLSDLLAAGPSTFPAYYRIPHVPPVTDQDGSPQCVPYSNGYDQNVQDRRSTKVWFNFDEDRFFTRIGGTAIGSSPREALKERRKTGYPVQSVGHAGQHRIRAYYRVPLDRVSVKSAIRADGGVLLMGPWFHSWLHAQASGKLPPPDYEVGFHQFYVFGWNDAKDGFKCLQTWGSDYGNKGRFVMPYGYLGLMREAWKTT